MSIGTRSDSEKVLLGCPRKGPEVVGNYPIDSAVIAAGIAGCLNSSGEFVAGAASPPIGISRGVSMKHVSLNSVTQKGKQVPLLVTDEGVFATLTVADLTFTAREKGAAGNSITVAMVDGGTAGAEVVSVVGSAISVSMDDGVSTAQEIFDALEADAEAMALIEVEISGTAGDAVAAFAADALEDGADSYPYVVEGANVYISDTTGLAVSQDTGTTNTGWKYASEVLEGVSPTLGGSAANCALVNF
jgi:hypothetical protein